MRRVRRQRRRLNRRAHGGGGRGGWWAGCEKGKGEERRVEAPTLFPPALHAVLELAPHDARARHLARGWGVLHGVWVGIHPDLPARNDQARASGKGSDAALRANNVE